jgi:CRP-like cAMP-binding protein
LIDGQPVRTLGRGDGFGEIALIRDCRRTASVQASTPLTLRALRRSVFVAAMNGYSPSAEVVSQVITTHLGATPPPLQGAATAE